MSTTSVPDPNVTYDGPRWLTRDSNDSGLGDIVDVWLDLPTRHRLPGGGAMWLGPGDTGVECRELSCTLDYAVAKYRTLPDTDRECVRIG